MPNIVALIGLISLPILIPMVIVVLIFGVGNNWIERLGSSLSLNADKGLSSQGLLWLSILCPFLYFITLGGITWQGYEISITSAGINTFFSISKLPLAILSIIIPLSVLVSRFHATKQTAEQI